MVEGVIEGRYVALSGQGIALTLQRVDEPKTVKNRMHMDLLVDDLDEVVRRMESLGATRHTQTARQQFGQTWHVLADPEGNEFCVASDGAAEPPPAEEGPPIGPQAAAWHRWATRTRVSRSARTGTR